MGELDDNFKKLEELGVEEKIEEKKVSIKALKRSLGPDWKQQLLDAGISLGKAITSPEARQSLRAMAGSGQELRDLNRIGRR